MQCWQQHQRQKLYQISSFSISDCAHCLSDLYDRQYQYLCVKRDKQAKVDSHGRTRIK